MAISVNFAGNAPGRGGYGRPVSVRGNARHGMVLGTFDFDASYPANGYDISTSLFAEFKQETNAANLLIFVASRGGYVFDIDYTAKKIKLFRQTAATSALVEVTAGVDVTAANGARFMALGPLG